MNQKTLKHKLTFFLHTSLTISKDDGSGTSTHFYDHLRLLDFYAYGNIKTLAKKITFDNSMLIYLDNTSNNACRTRLRDSKTETKVWPRSHSRVYWSRWNQASGYR